MRAVYPRRRLLSLTPPESPALVLFRPLKSGSWNLAVSSEQGRGVAYWQQSYHPIMRAISDSRSGAFAGASLGARGGVLSISAWSAAA